MLSRAGGRRVFVRATKQPEFFAGLEKIFDEMARRPGKLRYWLEKDIPGAEIVFANDRYKAETVWKHGEDLRVLVGDNVREKEIAREIKKKAEESEAPVDGPTYSNEQQRRQYDHYAWQGIANGELTGTVSQPADVTFIPPRDDVEPPAGDESWKAKTAAFELRAGTSGLFKVTNGRAVKIAGGDFASPVVSSNGRWAIVLRSEIANEGGQQLMRVNLGTNRVLPVADDELRYVTPIAYVPSINRFLVGYRSSDEYEGEGPVSENGVGNYWWMRPETGAVQHATGEVRPLAQQRYRALQSTSVPFEYWAAISDSDTGSTEFGIYSTKTFTMRPVMKLPRILFNSQAMWVDEAASRVYFVYEGHVLAVPFKE